MGSDLGVLGCEAAYLDGLLGAAASLGEAGQLSDVLPYRRVYPPSRPDVTLAGLARGLGGLPRRPIAETNC